MQMESALPESLHEFIHEYGAMEGLKSDNAKSKTSFAMKDLLQMYTIKDQKSEPHYQHQNLIEWHIQDIKQMVHGIMDCIGCPALFWLLCLLYVIGLCNILMNSKGKIPLTMVMGTEMDVSLYLDFHFWQEVFVEVPRGGELLKHLVRPWDRSPELNQMVLLPVWHHHDHTQKWLLGNQQRPVRAHLLGVNIAK